MKKLSTYIWVVIIFFLCFFNVHAQEVKVTDPSLDTSADSTVPTVEHIDNMDVQAVINSDSSISVVETVLYDFGDQFKHGIYRTIPTSFTAKGEPGHIKISVEKVTDESGKAYAYSVTPDPVNVKIGDANAEITGKHTYKIFYTLTRSIGYFDTYDEWYWNVTGNQWNIPINSATVAVILPQAVASSNLKLKDYCGGYGAIASCGTFSQPSGNTVTYALKSGYKLNSNEGVTIAVGFPKGLVRVPTQSEFVWAWFLRVWFIPFPFLFVFLAFRKKIAYFRKRHTFFKNNTIVAEYDSGKFSVLETALLVNHTLCNKDISAVIVSLAVRRYITIENKNGDFCFTHAQKDPVDLTPSEKIIFQTLNGTCASAFGISEAGSFLNAALQASSPLVGGDYIINDGKIFNQQRLNDPHSWSTRLYMPLFLAVNPGIFIWLLGDIFLGGIWAGFIFSGTFILAAIVNIFLKPEFVHLTDKGFEAERMLRGLKLYIEVAEKDRINFANAPAKTPELFEKLLPYAIIFGLETKWAKEFEGFYKTNPPWYTGDGRTTFSSYYFVNSFSSMHQSVNTAIVSSIRASTSSSSGGSSGGGFSGGGGGGGGGGSW